MLLYELVEIYQKLTVKATRGTNFDDAKGHLNDIKNVCAFVLIGKFFVLLHCFVNVIASVWLLVVVLFVVYTKH